MVAPAGRLEAKLADGSPGAIETLEGGAWADPPTADPEGGGAAADPAADVACEMVVACCPCATARDKTARRRVVL